MSRDRTKKGYHATMRCNCMVLIDVEDTAITQYFKLLVTTGHKSELTSTAPVRIVGKVLLIYSTSLSFFRALCGYFWAVYVAWQYMGTNTLYLDRVANHYEIISWDPLPEKDPSLILSQTEITEPYYYILMKDCSLRIERLSVSCHDEDFECLRLVPEWQCECTGLMLDTPLSTNFGIEGTETKRQCDIIGSTLCHWIKVGQTSRREDIMRW